MAYKVMGTTASPFYSDMMIYYIMCDTPADLPSTISDIGYGTTIGYGSRADIISDSSKYLWNGSQWVKQKSGQEIEIGANDIVYDNTDSGLTATNVQDAIDELKDTDETQDRALAELQGENANQQLEINYAINTGAKNLFPITAISQTIGGVTFTVNGDGTVTANGTKTNNDWFILSENNSFDAGTYTLSDGLPNDTINCQLIIATARSMSAAIMATAVNSRPQTKTFTTAQTGLYYAMRIASGTTVNNLTFKPMLRRAEITDDTFESYAPTNRELYETKLTANDVWGYGQPIPDSADLDDYTTGGKYYGGNSAGNSVLNLPVANGSFTFTLEVKQATPSMTYQYLRVCRLADDPYIYCRRRYNSWGSWYRFTGEAVATASVQSVNSPLMLNREDITPLETDEIKETNEIEETE